MNQPGLMNEHIAIRFEGIFRIRPVRFNLKIKELPLFLDCLLAYRDEEVESIYFYPRGTLFRLDDLDFTPVAEQPITLLFFDLTLQSFPAMNLCHTSSLKLPVKYSLIDHLLAEIRYLDDFSLSNIQALADFLRGNMLRAWYHQNREDYEAFNEKVKDARIADALNYIHQNLGEKLSLEMLGNEIFLAPAYLGQRFTRQTGLPFRHYLDLARVLYGLKQLSQSNQPIKTIAEKTGFVDQAYFNRRVRGTFHASPKQIRNTFRNLYSESDFKGNKALFNNESD